MMTPENPTRLKVQDYYGKVLQSKADLKTNACCSEETVAKSLRPLLKQIHPEVLARFYGCGAPFPECLRGSRVLDLGCGTGRDVFLLSNLVSAEGSVVGVDMTVEQLALAREYQDYHRQQWGFARSNIEFKQGYLEDLASAGIADNSVDVVISNCVINLSPDKRAVFSEIFRVLKPGGELYFSDVFAGRRIPPELSQDPVLVGECLAGAMYKEDFRRLLLSLDCADFRLVSGRRLKIEDPEVLAKVGNIDFYSLTLRAFKLDLEDRCEDYGQIATYLGTMSDQPHAFSLDDHHTFETNLPLRVCSNTAAMLSATRFAPHFRVEGDLSQHFGMFDCAPASLDQTSEALIACC